MRSGWCVSTAGHQELEIARLKSSPDAPAASGVLTILGHHVVQAIGVMGVLKTGTSRSQVFLAQVDSAIPVVHVKIQYRHPINARQAQRVDRRDRDAVQQAKPHR